MNIVLGNNLQIVLSRDFVSIALQMMGFIQEEEKLLNTNLSDNFFFII
jgi:hypothetical protein